MSTRHPAAYTGQLYQFHTPRKLNNGAYVAINGPWDTYGIVTSSAQEADGRFLNQIRGAKPPLLERIVASF
jgi:hypothetical protein